MSAIGLALYLEGAYQRRENGGMSRPMARADYMKSWRGRSTVEMFADDARLSAAYREAYGIVL